MTNTTSGPDRPPGYRGALAPRNDRLARIWVVVVAAVLVLIFILPFFGIPSRLFPEPTAVPIPSVPVASGSPVTVPSASP
jgi:energy-converting hydrogenase Eha subunit F